MGVFTLGGTPRQYTLAGGSGQKWGGLYRRISFTNSATFATRRRRSNCLASVTGAEPRSSSSSPATASRLPEFQRGLTDILQF